MRLALPIDVVMNREGSASDPQRRALAGAVLGGHLRHVETQIDPRLSRAGLEDSALPVHETGHLITVRHFSIELGGLLAV